MEKSVVMHIRIPSGLAAQLKQAAEEGGYSLGASLKALIDTSQNTKMEKRIDELREDLKKNIITLGQALRATQKYEDRVGEAFKVVGFKIQQLTNQVETISRGMEVLLGKDHPSLISHNGDENKANKDKKEKAS